MELFWRASFDYQALKVADAIAKDFYEGMLHVGIGFEIAGDGVVAVGDYISPLIEQLVAERAHALRATVLAAPSKPPRLPLLRGLDALPPISYPQRRTKRTKKRKGKSR
jgi:hypothetical protein